MCSIRLLYFPLNLAHPYIWISMLMILSQQKSPILTMTYTRAHTSPQTPTVPLYSHHHECAQSCMTLCNSMDGSLPGSSIHGILQARILEWVAIPFCRESSRPRNWTRVLCIVGWFFSVWATREAQLSWNQASKHLFRQQIYLESDMLERITSLGIHAIQADDSGQGPLQKWN